MAVFRIEKSKDYTVMSNHHLRNTDLSLRAKGLLSQILSMPEGWDYTIAGLAKINREGKDAVRAAVQELEKAGYIVRRQKMDAGGKFSSNEYVVYEEPHSASPLSDFPTTEKPSTEKPSTEKPLTEKPLECNFRWNDLFVTMGYCDEKLPPTKEAAERRLSNFIRLLREERKSKGQTLVYVRVTEGYHTDGRLHHHLILNATGDDFEVIRRLWARNGSDVDFELYCRKEPVAHAQYITKEPREKGRRHVGDRIWRVSRNCRRPIVTKQDVPAGSQLEAPIGAFVKVENSEINSFGRFQYIHAIVNAETPNSGLG